MKKGDWVKSKRIEEVLGISGSEVRNYVNHLRQQGMPIVSGAKGYKYTTDPAEIDECLMHMYSRARSIKEAALGLQQAKKIITGLTEVLQNDLFDYIEK